MVKTQAAATGLEMGWGGELVERSVEDRRSWEPPSSDNWPGMVTSVLQTQRTELWKFKNALWSEFFSQIPQSELSMADIFISVLWYSVQRNKTYYDAILTYTSVDNKGCCILLYELFLFLQIIILQACIFFPFSQVYISAFSLEHVETYYFSS